MAGTRLSETAERQNGEPHVPESAYADRITVTVQQGNEVEIYHLRKQGDTLGSSSIFVE